MSEETPEYGTARRRFDDCLETAKEDLFADEIKRLEIALQRTTALRIAFEDARELEQQLIGKVVIGGAGLMAQIIRLEKEREEFLDSKVQEGPTILENEEYNLEHIDSETIRLTRRR